MRQIEKLLQSRAFRRFDPFAVNECRDCISKDQVVFEKRPGVKKDPKQGMTLLERGMRLRSPPHCMDQWQPGNLALKYRRAHDGQLSEENHIHGARSRDRRSENFGTEDSPIE